MKVNYIYDNALAARLPDLTYADLLNMLPRVTSRTALPVSRTLHAHREVNRFLDASDGDITITVYRDGVYLYEEQSKYTAFSVFMACECVKANYVSVQKDEGTLDREAILHCKWYLPLMIAGQTRLMENANKDQYKIRRRISLKMESLMNLMNAHVSMGEHSEYQSEEEAFREIHKRLEAAKQSMTVREREVIYLMDELGLTRKKTALKLHVTPQSISKTRSRGLVRMRDALVKETE